MTRILKSFEFSRTFGLEKITTTKNPALVSGSSPISGVQVFEWRQRVRPSGCQSRRVKPVMPLIRGSRRSRQSRVKRWVCWVSFVPFVPSKRSKKTCRQCRRQRPEILWTLGMIYEPVNPCILVSFSILRSEVPCVCNVILCQIQSQKGNRLDHRSPLLSYVSPVSTYREYLVKINVWGHSKSILDM